MEATVLTANIPCPCGVELNLRWNMSDWVLKSYPVIICPLCNSRYEVKVGQAKEANTEVTNNLVISDANVEELATKLALLAQKRGAR